jgi:site-specific DNA recombinase
MENQIKVQASEVAKKFAAIYCYSAVAGDEAVSNCKVQEEACRTAFERFVHERKAAAPTEEWELKYVYKEAGKRKDMLEFKKLQANICDGNIDVLFVYKLDRISRSVVELIDLFLNGLNLGNNNSDRKRTELVSVKDGLSTTAINCDFITTILAAVAELDREAIVNRVVAIIETKRRTEIV